MSELECEVKATVNLTLPKGLEPEELSSDDIRSMVCAALGHNHCRIETQLIKNDIAQSADLEDYGASEPVMVPVWIDVDWNSIQKQ